MLTAEMIAEFEGRGGKITKLHTGAKSDIRKSDWDNLIRGTNAPKVETIVRKGVVGSLHLRAGFGLAR